MAKARIVYQVDDSQLDALRKELNEIKKKNKEIEEGFKGSNEELKKTGGVLGDLKGAVAGLGLAAVATAAIAEFAKLTQEIIKNRKEVAQLTGQTGKGLDLITAKLKATSQVFDKDFNEILQAANVLSKEFGVTLTEAIDEVNEGFTRGLDINGEYLHTLREYSTFIKEAGLNTRQFNVLIQRQVQQGIFSDKGIDAIKEAVISIREMTPATRDAIRSIGIDTDQLIGDIRSGATTYFEAVQQIATKTRELADPQKTGVILADVFRGAGEDAGNFVFTLDEVGNSFSKLTAEQEAYRESTNKLLESSENFNEQLSQFSTNFTGLTATLKTFLNDAGAATLRWINESVDGLARVENKQNDYKKAVERFSPEQLQKEQAKLTEEYEKQEAVLTRILTRDKDFFESMFGGGKNGDKARENLTDISLKLEVIKRLEEERNNNAPDPDDAPPVKVITQEIKKIKELGDLRRKDIDDQKSDFIKEVESKQERNDLLASLEEKLQEDLTEINKEGVDNREEIEKEALERRQEFTQEAINGLNDIFQSFTDLRIQQISQQIDAVELARNRELELAEGNKEREAEINAKFDRQIADLRTKQANQQKLGSLFEIAVNTGVGISKTLAQLGLPAAIPFIALAAGLGAAQAAFVLAQPVPKFAKGTLDVPGSGTGDTVHAMLTPHEAVIPVQETKDYYPALKAIYTRAIDPEIINNIAKNGGSQPNITVNDYDKLAKAVMNQPQFNISMNESGFSYHMYRQNKSLHLKQNKFKFNN